MKKETSLLFLGIISASVVITFISNRFLLFEDLYYNHFAGRITTERIEEIINESNNWVWLSYLLIPLIYTFKFFAIAFTTQLSFFLINKKYSFSLLLKIVMLAELPFLAVPIIKLCWFLFIQTDYTLSDLQYFYPLSALQFFDVKNLATWQIYPLQLLNVFEIVYWVWLAYLLKIHLNLSFTKGMEVVASSYGTGLLLWVCIVVFLTISI